MVFFDKFYDVHMPPPQPALIELLLSHGAEIDAMYADGLRPIHLATGEGHLSAVKILLAHGASLEKKPDEPYSILELAKHAGHTEIADFLEGYAKGDVGTASGDEPSEEEDKTKLIDAGHFQFEVPAAWTRPPETEEQELKRTVTAGAKELLDTSNVSLDFESFYAFNTPEQAMVLINALPIPESMSAHDYMVKLRAMNETKFEYGRQSGIVNRVIRIKLTEAEGASVLETEYLATQGRNNRTLIYCVASVPSPRFAVTISAFFPETDDAFRERVESVLNSVEFSETE